MTDDEYRKAMDEASRIAGNGPGWNARYLRALERCGLKLIDDPRPDGVIVLQNEFLRYCWAPIPLEGDPMPYRVPALIVPLQPSI